MWRPTFWGEWPGEERGEEQGRERSGEVGGVGETATPRQVRALGRGARRAAQRESTMDARAAAGTGGRVGSGDRDLQRANQRVDGALPNATGRTRHGRRSREAERREYPGRDRP